MRDRWLIGCVVLALSACGGAVRSSSGGEGGGAMTTGATTTGATTSTGGQMSTQGGASSSGGLISMGGQASMQVQCGKRFCPAGSVCCNAVYGTCVVPGAADPDIACMQPPRDGCASSLPAPVVLSCVQELGKPMDPTASASVSVPNGQISGEIVGALEGGCLEPLLNLHANGPALSAQAMSWTVTDGNRVWDVEVVVEGNKIPSLGGQKVSLSYLYEFGGFSPTRRELSVVTLMSPSHGVWTAEGGDLPWLGKLPLLLSRGPVVCSTSEECGSYERYDIDAVDPLSMNTVNLAHGTTSTFGPWVMVHGGYREQTSASSPCLDWFVADVHVAILGLM